MVSLSLAWWCMPLTPALQRQVNHGEFEDSLAYVASFRTARASQGDPVYKQTKTNKQHQFKLKSVSWGIRLELLGGTCA